MAQYKQLATASREYSVVLQKVAENSRDYMKRKKLIESTSTGATAFYVVFFNKKNLWSIKCYASLQNKEAAF